MILRLFPDNQSSWGFAKLVEGLSWGFHTKNSIVVEGSSWGFFMRGKLEGQKRIHETSHNRCPYRTGLNVIREIVIPDSVRYIDAEAFYSCNNLDTKFLSSQPEDCGFSKDYLWWKYSLRVFALFILIFRTLISKGGKGLRNFWLDMQSGSDAVSAEAVLYSNFSFLD